MRRVPFDLPWLVDPPEDFRETVRHLSTLGTNWRAIARHLAESRLNTSQLYELGVAIAMRTATEGNALRLGVLSNGTVDLLLPAITASAARHDVWTDTISTGFDQVAAQALNPNSNLNSARCNFILLAVDHRGLPLVTAPGDMLRAETIVADAGRYMESLRRGLRQAGCTVIVQTAPQVLAPLFGNLDRNVPGTLQWLIDHYNQQLRTTIASSPDLLLDTAALAELVGLANWHDPVQWTLGRFPFAHTVVPLYADWLGRLLSAATGKTRKCLVLDLDNTLWGGVLGEDGLAGIVLGNNSPAGEAYVSVQRTALALRARGILLAVASKNDEQVARSAFRLHPDMVLKEEHIAVFRANWQDKASNLRAIAQDLNLDVTSLVLLDDNPAERAQVRMTLPGVACPELPDDPALYADILQSAGYFESVAFTVEDRARADLYQAKATQEETLSASTDLELYLRSLEMRVVFGPFDAVSRTRVAQLINKTNQFNLTTRRYTEADVLRFEASLSGLTRQIRLIDRFGDHGIVAVVICLERDSTWIIDTWLMSCRVFNRQLEYATLNHIVLCARAAGIRVLTGEYIQSDRNRIVKDHYARLGFSPVSVQEEQSQWRLDTDSFTAHPIPMRIVAPSPLAEPALTATEQ